MSRLANYLSNLQRFGIRPGLERIRALLALAGNPQFQYPVALIGGTNGKGSTCEYLARLLATEGRRIGLFTSPHLYEWNERIRILPGGTELFEGSISDLDLDELYGAARPYIKEVARELGQPTEFEVVTFLGLWHFARQQVDAAVIEVGLGGKWDATNATEPLVSAVTHVALDHCDRLGDTVELIAADKVHIARPGRTFLTADTQPGVLEVFRSYCGEIGAHLIQVDISEAKHYQEANATLAHAVADEFVRAIGQNWRLAEAVTLHPPSVPGRSEIIGQNPTLLVDGANNPDGASTFARHLTETLKVPREKVVLVLGILADKDWEEMARILVPLARQVIVTQSTSPRALPVAELAAFVRGLDVEPIVVPDVPGAVAKARELAGPEDWIVATGSFTTIAEVPRS